MRTLSQDCDVCVVGAGVAGLQVAKSAADQGCQVLVCAKGSSEHSASVHAQGGLAAVLGDDDRLENHAADTLRCGAGLNDEAIVRYVVEQAPKVVHQLEEWGAVFDKFKGPANELSLRLAREGGHSHARVVHADGDATGLEIMRTLRRVVKEHALIKQHESLTVLSLLSDGGRVSGVLGRLPSGGLVEVKAGVTVLATGGLGRLYRETTNPRDCTGECLLQAWDSGAVLRDLEFMQFHPTTLYVAGATRLLISEAVRGEGAVLCDEEGQPFMKAYHPEADLAPRDVVSRSILRHMESQRMTHVYLDARGMSEPFAQRFPGLARVLHRFGLDPDRDLIPVRPSAHYSMGGIKVDQEGQTAVPGLLAAGECTSSGLHGANRLASNSLLEGLVLGQRAGLAAARMSNKPAGGLPLALPLSRVKVDLDLDDMQAAMRAMMTRQVGIVRDQKRLADAESKLAEWQGHLGTADALSGEMMVLRDQLRLCRMMVQAAQWRQESRGTHYRSDYPNSHEDFACHREFNGHDTAI